MQKLCVLGLLLALAAPSVKADALSDHHLELKRILIGNILHELKGNLTAYHLSEAFGLGSECASEFMWNLRAGEPELTPPCLEIHPSEMTVSLDDGLRSIGHPERKTAQFTIRTRTGAQYYGWARYIDTSTRSTSISGGVSGYRTSVHLPQEDVGRPYLVFRTTDRQRTLVIRGHDESSVCNFIQRRTQAYPGPCISWLELP